MSRTAVESNDPQGLAHGPAPFVSDATPESAACDGTRLRADGLAAPEFQRAVLASLAARPDLAPVSLGPFRVRVTYGQRAFEVRLDELFKRHRHGEVTPDDAAEEIKAALGVPGAAVRAAGPFPRLVPVADVPPGAHTLPCPFDPALAIFFVRTLPSGHVPLRSTDVADGSELWSRALANLRDLTLPLPVEADGEGPALVLRFATGDGLDAARALLGDLMLTMAGWVQGRAHVALPARDLLVMVGDADPAALAATRSWVAECHAHDPFPLSPRWYGVAPNGALCPPPFQAGPHSRDTLSVHHEEIQPMDIVRSGSAVWRGDLMNGQGVANSQTGAVTDAIMTFGRRFGEDTGANPEELIATAHASCYSMALSAGLARGGTPPEEVRTTAAVTLRKGEAGFRITGVHLTTEAKVPGITPEAFQVAAAAAKDGCPVSRLLAPGLETLTLEAKLV